MKLARVVNTRCNFSKDYNINDVIGDMLLLL